MINRWEDVIAFYQNGLHNPRYRDSCREMLSLIKSIREDRRLGETEVGLAHQALTLRVPNAVRIVHVLWLESNKYKIFLDCCESSFYGEETRVEFAEVIPTILEYFRRTNQDCLE